MFLKAAATAAGAAAASSMAPRPSRGATSFRTFEYGVASGDPLPWAVLIWTRVTPFPEARPGLGRGPAVQVAWEVALDPWFFWVVQQGTAGTSADMDYTVKVDVAWLQPSTTYFYRFRYQNETSPVGITKTAPSRFDENVGSIRFGLVSCANWESGFFSAYRHLAARNDLDFILHVGDYIYEYATGGFGPGAEAGRINDPENECILWSDYCRRHAQYKSDPDLQGLHARYPFICTWDDHEVANDQWRDGAENHTESTEGPYLRRKRNGYLAYLQWVPVRQPSPFWNPGRIYRRFAFGSLADLNILDLRQYRDQQVGWFDLADIDDPRRSMLGTWQRTWLKYNLMNSRAKWRLLGNSVMFAPWQIPLELPAATRQALRKMNGGHANIALPVYPDLWAGYVGERQDLIRYIHEQGIANVVWLTGDIHSTFANEVPLDPFTYARDGGQTAGVEFLCTSITSDNVNDLLTGLPPRNPLSPAAEDLIKELNPWMKDVELDSHGFTVIDVTSERVQADNFHISERFDRNATLRTYSSWQTTSGAGKLMPASSELGSRG
jgi:alkaline phosphatase D